jgi:hypothetical protein
MLLIRYVAQSLRIGFSACNAPDVFLLLSLLLLLLLFADIHSI